jgi:hypothetical protein
MNPSQSPNHQGLLQIPHYKLLFIISFATALSWSAWAVVILKLDPELSTDLALPLFFLSLAPALAGTFAIILFFIKKWRAQSKIYVKHVTISLRQGILLSACTSLCLFFLMFGLLRIWNGLILVAIMTLLEFYFSSKDELS